MKANFPVAGSITPLIASEDAWISSSGALELKLIFPFNTSNLLCA
jgi:hypothetical protein